MYEFSKWVKTPFGFRIKRSLLNELREVALPYIREYGDEKGFNLFCKKNPELVNRVGVDFAVSLLFKWNLRRRRFVSGHHSKEEWGKRKKQFGNRCFYCGARDRELVKDHIVPICDGGKDDIDNIIPSCRKCNRQKFTKAFDQFCRENGGRKCQLVLLHA